MYTCDLNKFRSYISCKGYGSGNNKCSVSKLLASVGCHEACMSPSTDPKNFHSVMLDIFGTRTSLAEPLFPVVELNDKGDFEKSDSLILQLAMESGKVVFINGLPDEQLTHNTTHGNNEMVTIPPTTLELVNVK